jgi:predicted GNAT superfamily acetyltransferase
MTAPWSIEPATPSDLGAIESLRRADGDCLGFIPKMKYEHIVNKTLDRGRRRWVWERLLVCRDNGEVTGFLLGNIGKKQSKIEQICVRNDARRMERALSLESQFASESKSRGHARIRARVAADIEATLFWAAAGYDVVGQCTSTFLNVRESKSKRLLLEYEKEIDGCL